MARRPRIRSDEPAEIVLRRSRGRWRRVRRPVPPELRDAPLLYRIGLASPVEPLTLLAAFAVALALAAGVALWLWFRPAVDLRSLAARAVALVRRVAAR